MKINSGYALYFVALCFTALNLFLQVLPINTSEYFVKTLHLSATEVISLSSVFFIFYAAMQIPGGLIFDKFGIKVILPLGLFLTMLGSILYMLCTNGLMLALSRSLTGLGSSIAYICGIFIAVKSFSQQKRSFFIGLVEASATVGAILAAKVFHQMMVSFGWHAANMMIIIFSGILLIIALIFVKGLKHESVAKQSLGEIFLQVISLFKNKVLVLFFAYSFFTWAIIMSYAGYWLKNYMINMHHYSETESLNIVQIYWASFLVSGLVIGFFTKNVSQSRKVILFLSILGFVDYMCMAVPIRFSHWGLVLVALFGGISAAGVILAFTLISKVISEELSGTAIAVNNTFIVLGGLFGQIAFGTVVGSIKLEEITHLPGIDPQYYFALLIYPLFTFVALVSIIYALKLSKDSSL